MIAAVAYDETSHTLTLEFRSGTTYDYFDVPLHVYEGLIGAASAGTYFAHNIRDVYRFARTGVD